MKPNERFNHQQWYQQPQNFERHTFGPVTNILTRYITITNKMVIKNFDLPQCFSLLHHIKKIAIRPVFICSPLTFCIFVLSSNSIHKQCDNNPSGSSKITYFCKRMSDSIANSEISILNPLKATLPDLSHTYWLLTVLVCTRWLENRSIYRSGFSWFTMSTKLTNLVFWCSPLTFDWCVFNVN